MLVRTLLQTYFVLGDEKSTFSSPLALHIEKQKRDSTILLMSSHHLERAKGKQSDAG